MRDVEADYTPVAETFISHAMGLQRSIGNRQTHQLLTRLSAQTPTLQREGEGLHMGSNRLEVAQEAQSKGLVGTSARDFVRDLMVKINGQLAGEGVKNVMAYADMPGQRQPNEHGEFNPMMWQIVYNPTPRLDEPAHYDELANTIYHEARHAEQFYKIMQYLAYRGLNADAITRVTKMQNGALNRNAVDHAVGNKDGAAGWGQDTIAKVKGWYGAMYDMTFDQAVANHADAHDSQTVRFERENAEKKDLEAKQRNAHTLKSLGETLYGNALACNISQLEPFIEKAASIGGVYPGLLDTLKMAIQLQDVESIQEAAAALRDQATSDYTLWRQQYLAAHARYKNYAHEQDAYAAGDSVSRALTEMRKTNVAPPALPPEINAQAWKTAIEIKSTVFKVKNTGGKNIKPIATAIDNVVLAHGQAIQDQTFTALYQPLVTLQETIEGWLKKKENKTGANALKRRAAADNLLTAVNTYLAGVGFHL
jgi:hypothetical protein